MKERTKVKAGHVFQLWKIHVPSNKPFIGEKCGLFRQERSDAPRNASEPLPKVKVIGIDPGQNNLWSVCLYNSQIPMSANDQDEAILIFNLKRRLDK